MQQPKNCPELRKLPVFFVQPTNNPYICTIGFEVK